MTQTLAPAVKWSQTQTTVSIVVELPDCTPETSLEKDSVAFKADTASGHYAFSLALAGPVAEWKQLTSSRCVELIGQKSAPGFWQNLYTGPKQRFVKVDFSKFKDEDQSDDEPEQKMPAGMGMPGMGGAGGMPGMPGMGGAGADMGMGGMESLMNNPEMLKMMQNNPEMLKMMQGMKNPDAQDADSDDEDQEQAELVQ